MNYLEFKTDDIETATHWIGTYDERFQFKFSKNPIKYLINIYKECLNKNVSDIRITLNVPYRLFDCRSDGSLVIIDDLGKEGTIWECHKGYFVKYQKH